MRPVRSITLAPTSCSRFFCWTGLSGASPISTPASCSLARPATSSTWPLPSKVAGRTVLRRKARSATTTMPIASARPSASSSRASASRRAPSRGNSGATITARSPRATSGSAGWSKLFSFVLRLAALLGLEIQRMRRLQRRERMLVDELDLPAALEHEAELVEAGDRPLEHHAVHQEQGHAFPVPCGRSEEQILQLRLRAVGRWRGRNEIGRRLAGHDGRDRMLVDQLRGAFAPQQHRESVEPGDHALQLNAFDEEDGDRQLGATDAVQEMVLQAQRSSSHLAPSYCSSPS